jgi:hypothetical protein
MLTVVSRAYIYLIVRYLRMFRVVFVDVFLKINQCILQTRGSSVRQTNEPSTNLNHRIFFNARSGD